MYTVNLQCRIHVSPAKLMKIWRKPEILLGAAHSLKSLKIVKREKNRLLTAWEIEIEGVAVRWRQWDCLNAKTGTIGFKMEDGDFEQYGGEWKIISDGAHGSLLSLKSDIDWGIPRLEPYLLKPLQKKTTLLFKGFLKSIQQVSDDGQ